MATSILTNGSLGRIVASAMNAVFYDITLHRRDAGVDDYGAPVATFTDHVLRGAQIDISASRAYFEAVPDGTVRFIVQQHRAPVAPRIGDEITARGARWHVVKVAPDPAAATWAIDARLA